MGFTPPGASTGNSAKANGAKANHLPAPKVASVSRGKGKAKAPDQNSFGNEEDEEEYFLMAEDDLIADSVDWEQYADFGQGTVGASRGGRGDAIEIDDEDEVEEDDDDDVVLLPTARAPGKVNVERRKGPMIGSSPPKGSIFISTMSTAVRHGCMFPFHIVSLSSCTRTNLPLASPNSPYLHLSHLSQTKSCIKSKSPRLAKLQEQGVVLSHLRKCRRRLRSRREVDLAGEDEEVGSEGRKSDGSVGAVGYGLIIQTIVIIDNASSDANCWFALKKGQTTGNKGFDLTWGRVAERCDDIFCFLFFF